MCVAVYCRRSVDPADLGVSVAVQERNGRRYAAEYWPDLPVRVFTDNDLSAANPTVVRPAYREMIDLIRAGRVAHVVTREQSRLTRQPAEWEALCTTLQVARINEVHQTAGGAVSVAEGSRLPGRIMAVVDAEYVEQGKIKVRTALTANADDGRPHGRPGYGYRRGEGDRPTWEPDPDTAPVAARIVHAVADGLSLGAVARTLNDEGIPTPRGAALWQTAAVRTIVTAHRLIGQRVHQGRVIPATWDPIVDRATWERAQMRLNRWHGTVAANRRRFLLTGGTARCAGCDTPLISATTPVRGERVPSYQCPHPTRGGCGHCSILATRLEDHVSTVIAGWLTDPDFAAALTERLSSSTAEAGPLRAELDEVDGMLADLAVRWASGDLLELEHAAARRTLLARRGDLVDALTVLAPRVEVTPELLVAAWESGDVLRRKQAAQVLARVRVCGAFADGRRLSVEERVSVVPAWAT